MTVQELIDQAVAHPFPIVGAFGGEIALAFLVGQIHGAGRGGAAPWKYVYAVLVYAACVPGVLATLLTAYTLFFLRADLLEVNVFVYFAPIIAMAVTLFLIHRRVDFDEIPGFDRLWGLITMIAVSFGIVFALSRMFFGLFFFGSIANLIAISAFVFALLKWGTYMAFRKRGAPKASPPTL